MSDDVMDQQWACLTCSSRLRFGELISCGTGARRQNCPDVLHLHCPKCDSPDLHPADKTTHEVPNYVGEKGAIQ